MEVDILVRDEKSSYGREAELRDADIWLASHANRVDGRGVGRGWAEGGVQKTLGKVNFIVARFEELSLPLIAITPCAGELRAATHLCRRSMVVTLPMMGCDVLRNSSSGMG